MSNDVEPAGERWRKLAAQTRTAASHKTDPEAKATMLDMAERYERLAQYAEAYQLAKTPSR